MDGKIAVMSDLHSNKEALDAVLADIRSVGIGRVICLGDLVGYASGVRSTLNAVRDLECPVVMGNHDFAVVSGSIPEEFNDTARAGVRFAMDRLKPDELDWLRQLPPKVEMDGVTFLHASLADPREWNYVIDPEDALAHFHRQPARLAFCGHTHRPAMWWLDPRTDRVGHRHGEGRLELPRTGKVLVDVGSVGQPRDTDPRACYVIYHESGETVEFRRVEYDIKRTKRKILRAKLPRFSAQRLSLGR